jgi:hypothetical protein
MLQVGMSRVPFPMRSLKFFLIDLILPSALWPWGLFRPGIFLGVKGGWPERKADNLTVICEEIF